MGITYIMLDLLNFLGINEIAINIKGEILHGTL